MNYKSLIISDCPKTISVKQANCFPKACPKQENTNPLSLIAIPNQIDINF